ncbi:MAG: hypothetical protein ACM3ZB_09080 [bacterium]
MRRVLLIAVVLAASGLAGPPADPNFTGAWRLDSDSSDLAGMSPAPVELIRIKHEGQAIWCECRPDWGEWTFTLDSKEARIRSGQLTLSTIAKWEGDAVLVNTIVYGQSGSYTQADRWKLSRDGLRLTVRREIIRPNSPVREALLVYDRDDAPVPAPKIEVADANPAPRPAEYRLDPGTRIPLTLLNRVSTKQSAAGDRIYLETAFPIVTQGRMVIPPGSYVAGTLTTVKRPGRLKGRGEIYLRFDSITLPNGVTRDFRARAGSADADMQGELDRSEGKIRGETSRMDDARDIGEGAATGATVGAIAGAAAGRPGLGTAAGAAAGAAAGVMSVLLTHGPDIVLARGTMIEMVLDRPLVFAESELPR